mmetsp:Transcript_105200/g.209126  ORF Transcript_105200/g.209126 Transcript_105200/m.209126 type:complete len:457 (+) Transcript_105200:86-1456(+)|eukprot:CAMPEP_0172725168 /NCGR_PEP_ID=MMETSP1074-20121228/87736_1 /TAXON_ID=2916 /ORGANISM="Ceratium fusus, Strain PA161109" /LENGTH=456 /DNA_ID=CAMNT_0013551873 /DNA_START=68 /DNA_END=1438 /DNA_ORIENTATION=-
MSESTSTLLLKRNREIAEVREELVRLESQLDGAQAKNHTLLEETSVLNTAVAQQSARAAVYESQLADLFEQRREKETELAKQQAAHMGDVARLSGEVAAHKESLECDEADAEAKRKSMESLDLELVALQEQLELEDNALTQLRKSLQEQGLTGDSPHLAASMRAVEDEIEAMRARHHGEQSDAASAKQQLADLEAEISNERSLRDEVSDALRKAVLEQARDPAHFQATRAALEARGGDAAASLNKFYQSGNVFDTSSGVLDRTAQLRNELQASEDQCKALQHSLDTTLNQDKQTQVELNSQLDGARNELQKSLRDVADAHSVEVNKLESEVQAERQCVADEEVAQRMCADQVVQLKELRSKVLDEQSSAFVRTSAGAGRCAALVEELLRVQGEVQSTGRRCSNLQERLSEAEQQGRDARANGVMRARKIRGMIEALWEGLRHTRAGAESGLSTGIY